ncbi:polysaccharide biosynthesis protein [Pedobacter yulinensis]|uniref:Polysaccharide biosynthesis protein n=1 Tax=Pedobacter yulinensis TaxID=2126353 RepID=A0A2T3HLF6_9SPHI|nr:nucleoside-diphosphate sugar epimerase/dehydratase [Pedobacter yulinensis]PST83243.1 polysaccharide biosynthesis protein [Pedobacter yulinensis]
MRKFLFYKTFHSRWLILVIDQAIVFLSMLSSVLLVQELGAAKRPVDDILLCLFAYHAVAAPLFIVMRMHTGMIRHSNLTDVFKVFRTVLLASLVYFVAGWLVLVPRLDLDWRWFYALSVLNLFVSATLLMVLRMAVKLLFCTLSDVRDEKKEAILIYGTDRDAVLIKHGLELGPQPGVHIVGFIDDKPARARMHIEQKNVYCRNEIPGLHARYHISKLIVSASCKDPEARKVVAETCLEAGITVTSVPAPADWLDGALRLADLPPMKIEDLLQREPITFDQRQLFLELTGKRVLVTGAAGSIGSEIVRQVLQCEPALLILCDQAETPLHNMQLEIESAFPDSNCIFFMANIQDEKRMNGLFAGSRPEIVFHAAALKHVPMMENNPQEAVMTNVWGTKNLADLSVSFNVEKFVMISTDKAVNPTNVMGASKRIAEMYIQSLQGGSSHFGSNTLFITTRFGNVLGSNGSVVPRFKSQIEAGGPVTITHPEIRRYFMTIPEAVQLVLEAAAMGRGGEIYIFDMGEPIRILDLALNMIKLSGRVPYQDVDIVYTGLRPGEKLYEELLNQQENTLPTHHHKILISDIVPLHFEQVSRDVKELLCINLKQNAMETVRKMKKIIPEYRSNNSVFNTLDAVLQS